MVKGHYASISSENDQAVANGLDHIVDTAPATAEVFGVTVNGLAYVRIDDDHNSVIAYAALTMTDEWKKFLNGQYREFAKYEKSVRIDENDEFLGSPRVDKPDPLICLSPPWRPRQ